MLNLLFNKEQSNLGGINKILFFAESDINVFGDIIDGQIFEILFLNNNIEPAVADIIPESSKFSEIQKSNNLFEYQFTCKVAKDDLNKRNALQALDNKKVILKIIDNNNQARLLGEPNNPCLVFTDLSKGQSIPDINAYTITFNWKSRYRAIFANQLQIVTADVECLNSVIPQTVAGQDFITSINIKNNTQYIYTASQTFTIESLGSITVTQEIQPYATETLTATIPIPLNAFGIYNLINSGACQSSTKISIHNYASFKQYNALQLTENSKIVFSENISFYNNQVVISYGTAHLGVDPIKPNVLICIFAGTCWDIFMQTNNGLQLRIPCSEGNGFTIHNISNDTNENTDIRAFLDNCQWTKIDDQNWNGYFGSTKILDSITNKIQYVPYDMDRNKKYNP